MNGYSQTPAETSMWIQNPIDGSSAILIRGRHAIHCGSSAFQKIEIIDTYSFGKMLLLAGTVVLTERDENIYHEMITHPALLAHQRPEKICIIGGGDGGCLREVLRHECVRSVKVVEIDRLVTATVKEHLPALAAGFDDPRAELVINDGCEFLQNSDQRFDCIIVDSYDPGGPVQTLETESFHNLVCNRLAPGGIAVFQADSPVLRPSVIRNIRSHIAACFAEYKPYICVMPSFPAGVCSFLICSLEKGGLSAFDNQRYQAIAADLEYYNDEVQKGAFLLPRHLKRAIES